MIRYTLSQLASGISVDVPIRFSTNQLTTPHGLQIPIIGRFTDLDGNDLVDPVSTTFTAETIIPVFEKVIKTENDLWDTKDNYIMIGGAEDPNKSGYLSTDLTKLRNITFSYRMRTGVTSNIGVRGYEEVVFRDTIPAEAVFIAEENPGWTFDEETRVATYVFISKWGNGTPFNRDTSHVGNVLVGIDAILNLKFPGAPVDTNIINSATVTLKGSKQPEFEQSIVLNDEISFTLNSATIPEGAIFKKISDFDDKGTKRLYDHVTHRDQNIPWDVTVKNPVMSQEFPDSNIEDLTVKDYRVDAALMYTGITFDADNSPVGTVDIILTYSDGTTETIAGVNPAVGGEVKFTNNPENIKSVEVVFLEGTYLEPEGVFLTTFNTEIINKNDNLIPYGYVNKRLYNYVDVSGTFINGGSFSGTDSSSIFIYAVSPYARINKSTNTSRDYFVDESIKFTLPLWLSGFPEGERMENIKIVDILPIGLEYEPNSTVLYRVSNDNYEVTLGESLEDNIEPEVIYNYQNTGQIALVWELSSIEALADSIGSQRRILDIIYQAKITSNTEEGINKNNVYMVWDNLKEVKPDSKYTSEDIYDINKNGNTTERISHNFVDFTYSAPKELIIKKEVKGSLDNDFLISPMVGTSEAGSTVQYRFRMFNNSLDDLRTLHFLDLLPTEGDLTVSESITEGATGRTERNSTFPITLSGPVTPPTGYTVYYTTDSPSADMKDFYNNASWSSTLSDYSLATSFKMVLNEGEILASGEEVTFEATFNIPNDAQLEDGINQAVNSYGVAVNNNLDFFESNFAVVEILKYVITGSVFDDFNENGLFDTTETGMSDYLAQLVDASGNPVLDLDGNPYQATTDENGKYTLNIHAEGTYRIKVLTPEGYEVATPGTGDTNSHITNNTQQYTDTFVLDSNNTEVVKNAGYYKENVSILVSKELQNILGTVINEDVSFAFTITVNDTNFSGTGVSYPKDDETNTTPVTITNGNFSVPANHIVRIDGVAKNGTYTITETPQEGYSVITPATGVVTGTVDAYVMEADFVNRKEIELIDYTVTKVWVGGPETKPTIEVQLYQDGVAYGTPVELTNGTTTYTWEDLPVTDDQLVEYAYTVDEVTNLMHYDKEVDGNTITNTYNPVTSDLVIKYVDEEGSDIIDPITSTVIVGDEYTTEQKVFDDYDFDKVTGDPTGIVQEGTNEVTYVYTLKEGTITSHHILEDGTKIEESWSIVDKVGRDYTTTPVIHPNYELIKVEGTPNGKIVVGTTEVTYIYKKLITDLIIKYVDEDGNDIIPQEETIVTIGDNYTTVQKEFDGYEFVEVIGEPEGEVTGEVVEVTYVYKKNSTPNTGTVVVYYEDEEGNQIDDPTTIPGETGGSYKTTPKDVDGYELIKVIGNETGTIIEGETKVIYVYKKKVPNTGITSNSILNISALFSALGILFVSRKKEEE